MQVALVGLDAAEAARIEAALPPGPHIIIDNASEADAVVVSARAAAQADWARLMLGSTTRHSILVWLGVKDAKAKRDLLVSGNLPVDTTWHQDTDDAAEADANLARWLLRVSRRVGAATALPAAQAQVAAMTAPPAPDEPLPVARGPTARRHLRGDAPPRHSAEADPRRLPKAVAANKEQPGLPAFQQAFLNALAHDLTTPLTPIRMQLHLADRIASELRSPALDRVLDVLDRNFTRLEHMLADVLDATRLRNDALALRTSRIDAARIVQDAVAGLAVVGRSEDTTINLTMESGQYLIEGDPARLGQVVDQLLTHALQQAPGTTIAVALERTAGRVVVTVHSEGRGLDDAEQERLFRPFTDAQSDDGGSGLGLFICRGIVEAHGGSLRCHSDGAGAGTTFIVSLPAA